jgi:hypothetical protein
VLDGQHPGVREQLLGEVIDELPVDEGVDAVADDLGHLFWVFFFLSMLPR